MLMDEPFGAVDPIVRERLQNEFLRIQEQLAKTILFVTHDIDEAIKLGDLVAVSPPSSVNRVGPVAAIDVVAARGDAVGGIENVRARRSIDVGHSAALSWSRLSARAFARAAVLPVGARFRR